MWHFFGFFFINQHNRENNNNPCDWSNNKNFHCNWFKHQWIARTHHRQTLSTEWSKWLWTVSVKNISINCFTRWRHNLVVSVRVTLMEGTWSNLLSGAPCIVALSYHVHSLCVVTSTAPIPGITRTSLTTKLLHRIGQAVGPVVTVRSVRNQIAHTVTATLDDPSFTALWGELSGALDELIDIITDPVWQTDMRSQIATLETCPISREMWEIFCRDLLKYLEVRNFSLLLCHWNKERFWCQEMFYSTSHRFLGTLRQAFWYISLEAMKYT